MSEIEYLTSLIAMQSKTLDEKTSQLANKSESQDSQQSKMFTQFNYLIDLIQKQQESAAAEASKLASIETASSEDKQKLTLAQ